MRRLSLACAPLPPSAALTTASASFSKSANRRLQKGKTLRSKVADAAVKIATQNREIREAGGGSKSKKVSSRASSASKGAASRRSNDRSRVASRASASQAILPEDMRYGIPLNDDGTPLENSMANVRQLFGIFQNSFETQTGDEASLRYLDGYMPEMDMLEQQHIGGHVKVRVHSAVKIDIPPVEVSSHPRTTSFLPREMLRRVLREEGGTGISSRTVTLSCLLRRNSLYRNAARDEEEGTSGMTKHITAQILDDASLVGDAALLVTEKGNESKRQLREVLADERPNTKIEDPDDNETLNSGLMFADNVVSDAEKPEPVDLHDGGKLSDAAVDEDSKNANQSEGESNGADDEDEAKILEKQLEALLPFRDGTSVPLSTNFVTRSDRVEPCFNPFMPIPFAKRHPLTESSSSLQPLNGVAMHGTIVAVKVSHNTREVLETAVDEYEEFKASIATGEYQEQQQLQQQQQKKVAKGNNKKRAKEDSLAAAAAKQKPPHPTASKITLDITRPKVEPTIVIHIMDEGELDFGSILFDA